jgi:protein-tyrosine phosphatase
MLFDYNEIIPGRLWVGCFLRPGDAKQLGRMGITVAICLQTDQDFKRNHVSFKHLHAALTDTNIDLSRISIQDFNKEDLLKQLPACVAEVEDSLARGWAKAYLYCTAGVQRSPTTAAAYLMKSRGISAREAHDYVVERRDCSPYLDVLEKYEESLGTSEEMRMTQVIE